MSTIPLEGMSWRRSLLALPLIRLEVPGWGRLARLAHVFDTSENGPWHTAPTRRVRGKWHGYSMDLNLSDWSERQTYFLARYHDLHLQRLIDRCVRPGERVVDVGANIGMLTLHAAARVGPAGVVDSFEPNPVCCRRIEAVLARNNIRQVRLHPMGLSDAPASLVLSILQNHTGMGTLAAVDPSARVTARVEVPVRVADEVLLSDPRPVVLVKIDVEGFETRVLRGMRQLLQRDKPIVTTEIVDVWLKRAGSSVTELLELMTQLGYEGFGLGTRRRLLRHTLHLTPSASPGVLPPGASDVVWIPHEAAKNSRERLRSRLGL
jgi:FkbM family methyltransferase